MEYGIIDFVGLSKFGIGKNTFFYKLTKEDISYMEIKSNLMGKNKLPYFKANLEKIKEYFSLKEIRRLDNYARIVLLLCSEILKNLSKEEREGFGIVLGTGFGSFKTNCDFLDSIIFQGFDGASPMFFTGTVHNSPLAPIGMFKDLKGPSYCVSNFENTFNSSLHLSKILLDLKVCKKILLIFADEVAPLMLYGLAHLHKIDENDLKTIPQEGGCAFILGEGENLLSLNNIDSFIQKNKKISENYGFTYFPEAIELVINLNKYNGSAFF